MKKIWGRSDILPAVMAFSFLVCEIFLGVALCHGTIMCMVLAIWFRLSSIKFSRSFEEMKDELESMKNRFEKLEEMFSIKVTELENANDEIATLKQEKEALIAHVGEKNDLNKDETMDKKRIDYYQDQKMDSCSDSGMGASPFLPIDTPISPPYISMNKPTDTPAGPNADITHNRLNSKNFPCPDRFWDFGEYFYTIKSFLSIHHFIVQFTSSDIVFS